MASRFSFCTFLLFSLLVLGAAHSAAAGESGLPPHTADSITSIGGAQEMAEFERQTNTSEGTTQCEDCGSNWGLSPFIGGIFVSSLGGFVVIAVVYSVYRFTQDLS